METGCRAQLKGVRKQGLANKSQPLLPLVVYLPQQIWQIADFFEADLLVLSCAADVFQNQRGFDVNVLRALAQQREERLEEEAVVAESGRHARIVARDKVEHAERSFREAEKQIRQVVNVSYFFLIKGIPSFF